MGIAYDGLLWTLRSLQELSSFMLLSDAQSEILSRPSLPSKELDFGWELIWSGLIRGLLTFSNLNSVADAALLLLGSIISSDLMSTCAVPPDVWDLKLFKRTPSMQVSVLYFIVCYFSHKGSQGDLRDSLHLRKNLLRAILGYFNWKMTSLFGLVLVIHFVGFLHKHNQYLLEVSIVLVEHGVEASKFLEAHSTFLGFDLVYSVSTVLLGLDLDLSEGESSILNEHVVLLLPAAVYALCAGCAPFTHSYRGFSSSNILVDSFEATDDRVKVSVTVHLPWMLFNFGTSFTQVGSFDIESSISDVFLQTDEHEQERPCELFECSVEVLSKIHLLSRVEASSFQGHQSGCLPRQFRDLLLLEMEGYILGAVGDKEMEKRPLSDVFFICSLLSNFIYGSVLTRKGEEASPFLSKMSQYLLELLDHAVNAIQGNSNDLQALGCSGSSSDYNLKTTLIASFRSFVFSPIFVKSRDETALDVVLYDAITQSMERLLKELAEQYNQFSECVRSPHSDPSLPDLPSTDSKLQIHGPSGSNTRIMDMELDVTEDTQDVDILPVGGIIGTSLSFSAVKWKLGMISLLSSFHPVLDFVTWDVLFELMQNERDNKVRENILYHLCQHFHWSSSAKITDLVKTMNSMFEMQASVKLDCFGVVVAACQLLATLLSLDASGKEAALTAWKRESELSLAHLGELVNKIAEFGLLDWSGRVRLIDCFCDFVLLSPQIGQTMIERLFLMLQDPDYRVRFSLARRIGVLFQTWDGHDELSQDICSQDMCKLLIAIAYYALASQIFRVESNTSCTKQEWDAELVNDFDAAIFLLVGRGLMGTTEVGCEVIGVWEDMVAAIISQSGHLSPFFIVLLDIENWYLEAIEEMKDFLHPYGVWPWGSLGVLPQIMLSRIGVLFSNFGVAMVIPLKGKVVTAKEVLACGPQPTPKMETVIVTLMHLALHSEKIELEAVFMMCVISAIDPGHRELVHAALDNLSRQLNYATRFKYLEQLLGSILFYWVTCDVSLVALVEIRQLFVSDAEPSYFMQYCCHWLLPALVLNEDSSNLNWVARVACQPLAVLVKIHFVPIFSVCIVLHCSKRSGWERGAKVLQSSILCLTELSESERDKLIKKHMVSIVSHVLSLASCALDPAIPFFSRETVARAIQTVVDGFLEMEDYPTSVAVLDKINIFRPDRVFMFLVEMHYKIEAAVHHRHRCHRLAGIEVLVDIIGHRASVSSTFKYLINLIGQFIGCDALQDQCCRVISALLNTLKGNPSKVIAIVLGEQLQFLVSKLVACCIPSETSGEIGTRAYEILSLLRQLTVGSDPSLHDYVRELEPFPEIDIFDEIREFHHQLCEAYSPRAHLLEFVKRSFYLPPRLLLCSVQALHKKLLMEESFQRGRNTKDVMEDVYWHCDPEIVQSIWTLVRMCGSDDASSIRPLVSDFVSKVGIGDPHSVVFHLPVDYGQMKACQQLKITNPFEVNFNMDTGVSEELLIALLKLLMKYLMDDSVRIVDLTSQSLRGILSTERGQRALLSFGSYERSLIEIHSKGVNIELVEKLVLDIEKRYRAEAISLEESIIWETCNKTFQMWICPLVYSLVSYCNDVILRLCQDIVLLKAEVAELLFPSVIIDLAFQKDIDVDLHKLISLQRIDDATLYAHILSAEKMDNNGTLDDVKEEPRCRLGLLLRSICKMQMDLHIKGWAQEHILTESNELIKSVQVFLNALNELRLCHVTEKSSLRQSKRESTKAISHALFSLSFSFGSQLFLHHFAQSEIFPLLLLQQITVLLNAKPSSYDSISRSTAVKARDSVAASSSMVMTTSSWDKHLLRILFYRMRETVHEGTNMPCPEAQFMCANENDLTVGLQLGLSQKSEGSKVYWLTIDYLVVAKSAVICGSYFTAMMYVEHWCEEHFNGLMLGSPDFSHLEVLPHHIEILMSAVTHINEPDSLYGIIHSHKLTSQAVIFEHEGNWSKALEYYDLQIHSNPLLQMDGGSSTLSAGHTQLGAHLSLSASEEEMRQRKPYKGLIRSLQQIGCTHVLDLYCQGLTYRKDQFHYDLEFNELQYEAAWRAGNWDLSLHFVGANSPSRLDVKSDHFNEKLHGCLRAFQEGDFDEFHRKLRGSKQELVRSVSCASEESTEYIYSTVIKLQILYHLGMAWHIRWETSQCERAEFYPGKRQSFSEPVIPTMEQLSWLNVDWNSILERSQLHMNLLEPFIAFRRVLLQILRCNECMTEHLLQSASTLRKGSRFSQSTAFLHEFKLASAGTGEQYSTLYWLGRLEEAKLLRAQGQLEMAISLAKYISQNCHSNQEGSDVYRLVGKWLAETRSSNSRTILEKYLKPAVSVAEAHKTTNKKSIERQSQAHFHLAHYADALFKSCEERLTSSEWQAAMRLRKHKAAELEALVKRLRSSTKGEKNDYSVKILELQRQLAMDKEEAEKLKDDRDNFLSLALEGYKRCLVIGDKYDVRVVFRLVSLWFSLSLRQNVINNMLDTIEEAQSYKFVPLVYQIASRMGSSKDSLGPHNFQFALASLVKKMAIDHPYHTIFQLLALANGDRIKDKQRSRNSFVVDMDKITAAKRILEELASYHGPIIRQMKQMVEIYIKLAELETKKEDTNKRVSLPREIRSVRQLELVPVVTATFPVDRDCHYHEGSFPHFKGLADSVRIMNGINAPKVVECLGSDGQKYRQLAKSGNDDLRQDAVMEQFFGLVNTFLQNNRDTWKRRLGVRTYKVVPFTPSAGVLEWVNGTFPLGEYLIGSARNGGAHGRYGVGDWSFLKCREHMSNASTEKDKCKAFREVCQNFRPVMHHFFLERFLQPADWFEKRLAYTRSVAASSMVGYIVGLGDRHSMNILIDQATAEVVHIDLGVAFEQGLMLKTPERVPFRLTRDIVDGMGVTGVEGVFRRCCEETLSVMRTNKEALLTIVEVFIHDPLYKWALSPLKALQRQKETDDDLETSLEDSQDQHEGNKDAARALMRVRQKLDGYEEGELRSVHGQVQQLIQDAIDPERLCQMFAGWGAWM
ncbi:hypothetical protein POTOM_050526 [Populus tomentosa]|uniref:Serine/threonine-protein kinase ATM n=1 Tax=Populus tomentosa TaxID=118781 RepID=A0A8X8C9E7_POPTO|nr:hypothetical protein POTOM_050526 [Populus tomentosa]